MEKVINEEVIEINEEKGIAIVRKTIAMPDGTTKVVDEEVQLAPEPKTKKILIKKTIIKEDGTREEVEEHIEMPQDEEEVNQ